MTNILGLSAYFHDAACCLLQDGHLTAAVQEEAFSRRKHDPSLPRQALRYCLAQADLTISDIACVAYYEDPRKKLGRQIWMNGPGLPHSRSILRKMDPGRPEREIREILGFEGPIEIVDHHLSHAASSFYFSGFPDAAIFTVDGVGEWATTTYGSSNGKEIEIFEEVQFPDSLGLLYSTLTAYLGFAVNEGEYKVMGLAPYGQPKYVRQILELVECLSDGQYRLKLRYFDFNSQSQMYSNELQELLGAPARSPENPIDPFHKDIARSLQVVLEDILFQKVSYLHSRVDSANLCMAGGVALNCVANGMLRKKGPFQDLFVQPAASDAGGALGAAAVAHLRLTGNPIHTRLEHVFLGPSFSTESIFRLLESAGLEAIDFRDNEEQLLSAIASRIANGNVVGWYSGRMEFGPRALGARSILADPRDPGMRDKVNSLIKQREGFRPFAPAILEVAAPDHFEIDHASPFMLETCQVRSDIPLPAITHVDNSARIQTVSFQTNPRFARLIQEFGRQTGCPILLNTSFNMKDEPIVCTPVDALICFVRSKMDTLVLEDFLIDRKAISPNWEILLANAQGQVQPAVSHEVYTFF